MNRVNQKTRWLAGIQTVSSVMVNGKYLTVNTLAGGHQVIINVINELTVQEHEAA